MRSKTKRNFSADFKREAVKLMSEYGARATAERLGVGENLLYKWRETERTEGFVDKPTNGLSLEEEVRRLRLRVQELEEEREILKKAAAYFAKHTR